MSLDSHGMKGKETQREPGLLGGGRYANGENRFCSQSVHPVKD